jgi:hypothetical protein
VAAKDPAAADAGQPSADKGASGELDYDPQHPGFNAVGVDHVIRDGHEWVHVSDVGWHRVDYRSTDERYAGKGFATRLKSFVHKYFPPRDGHTSDDLFNEARGKLAHPVPDELRDRYQEATDEELVALTKIREESRFESADDLVIQKVLSDAVTNGYLESNWDTVGGFVAKLVDTLHLTTPAKIFSALRLDYPGSQFRPTQESITVLRTRINPGTAERNLFAPGSPRTVRTADQVGSHRLAWRVHEDAPPFSGSAFTAEPVDGVPEFLIGDGPGYDGAIRLSEGAEIWRIAANGDEQLVAVFHGGVWTQLTNK